MFTSGNAQKHPRSGIGSATMWGVGLLVLFMACTGILFFTGCEQPNDSVTSETPEETEESDNQNPNGDKETPEPGKPDTPDTPDKPNDLDKPEGSDEPDEPDEPTEANTPDEPDTPVPPPEEPEAQAELTGAEAVETYLATLPENTEAAPYRIKVNGIDLSKNSTAKESVRNLYKAISRYVSLDLTGCTGASLVNVTVKTAPGKAYLVSLTLPDSVETIELNAFSDCTALASVNMPQVKTINHGAFSKVTTLTSVYMPKVATIEAGKNTSDGAFYQCTALTAVSMPKLSSVGDYAFYNCSALQSLTLGSTPPELGTNTFKGADALKALYVPATAVEHYKTTTKANWTNALKEKVQAQP
ncbi:MAG: leucine-rich repeat protein [Spirochaetaceae bacterium]|jgi:hypothetical protein|nr:leucine-rich repeat protein [Spirochaetaceae bacterium]